MKMSCVPRVIGLAVATLLLLGAVCPTAAHADGVMVKGTVYYSTTPLVGVTVELRRDGPDGALVATTVSDEGGGYGFPYLLPGTYCIVAYGPTPDYFDLAAYMISVADLDLVQDLHLVKRMTLLSPPQDGVVTTTSPQLCWEGLPEAASYTLSLERSTGEAVEHSEGIAGTCYTTAAALEVGAKYAWSVRAYDHLGHWVGGTGEPFRFTVRASGVKVSGTVYYSTTPLPGVLVELRRDTYDGPIFASGVSDAAGAYAFHDVPPGTFYIKFYGPSAEYYGWSAAPLPVGWAAIVHDIYLIKIITLLSPADGSLVSTPSPRFCWLGLPEAAEYAFGLNRSSDWAVIETRRGIEDSCYTTPAVLEPAVEHTWQVRAYDYLGHEVGGSMDQFHVTYVPLARRTYMPLASRRELPLAGGVP